MQNFSHTIWMGDIFEVNSEYPLSVKIIRNKVTGQTLGYGFIEFVDSDHARDAMLKLNGKPIPGIPSKRFKLNHASYGSSSLGGGDHSLFVGELTEDVDDIALFNAFKKYNSCRSAKIVSSGGKSKGYGFVRFGSEADMDKALIEMQNHCGLGGKPIRVSLAIPKRYAAENTMMLQAMKEQRDSAASSILLPSGIPDPFTAAVAACVSGSSLAHAEYYQTYAEYCQTFFANQLLSQMTDSQGPSVKDKVAMTLMKSSDASSLYNVTGTSDPSKISSMIIEHLDAATKHAQLVEKQKKEIHEKEAVQRANMPLPPPPDPMLSCEALASEYDRPKHIYELDNWYDSMQSSRWDYEEPNLHMVFNIHSTI